jgi:anaerobic selenocysteine-containing dehydrogenase
MHAHPCRFKWVIEAKIENQAKLVVVDPRFTRTASVADLHAPIRPGTDIAFLSGVIRFLLEKGAIQRDYVRAYSNASLIVKEASASRTGCSPATTNRPAATTSRAGTTNSMSRATPGSTTRGSTRAA